MPTVLSTTTPVASSVPLQPLLHDEVAIIAAPTQAWSGQNGTIGTNPVHGYWTGDQRFVSAIGIDIARTGIEHIVTAPASAREVVFSSVLRGFDGAGADPDVRLDHRRTVRVDGVTEQLHISDRRADSDTISGLATITIRLTPDAANMDSVKAGAGPAPVRATTSGLGASWKAGSARIWLDAPGATVSVEGNDVVLEWEVLVHALSNSDGTAQSKRRTPS